MSTYFLVFIAHDPEAVPPPKPLSVDDLQGRLCCCYQRTEELITPRRRGFVPQHMPVLGFMEGENKRKKRQMKKQQKKSLITPVGVSFHSRLSWWPSWPRPRFIPTLRCISCLLSRNDIVNGNNTSVYRKVFAVTMDEWQRNGKANLSCCHLQVFGGALLLGRVCRWKIRLILHITGLIAESCI